MAKDLGTNKRPITQERIFVIMMALTFGVSTIFLVKNLMGGNLKAILVIGGCLLTFVALAVVMHKLKLSQYTKQFVMSICLIVLVFVISANSGNYYSDDFPLFLAIIGLSGMYLEPRYTQVQILLITVAMAALYAINPDKADPLGQYIMCVVLMDVAAFTFYLTIRRGRQFINYSSAKAEEANQLLESIRATQQELEQSHARSAQRLEEMREANRNLESNTSELQQGSNGIEEGTRDLERTFATAHSGIQATGSRIEGLDEGLMRVEQALAESSSNLAQMKQQIEQVSSAVVSTEEVFQQLRQQTKEIGKLTDQMQNIAFHTTILALNASVEASRAGQYGVGFTVVANEVQRLATESEGCTGQVGGVMTQINQKLEQTARRMEESARIIESSQSTVLTMEEGFHNLKAQFDGLHQNIAEQNESVRQMDGEFSQLEDRVSEMNSCSAANQQAVAAIVSAIKDYQRHMELIVSDSERLQELSASMVDGLVAE